MFTIQKTRETKTAIKTSITTEQSQKLIQTMLTMSFGCVAFLRGLFPDDSFIDQRFVPNKFEADYNPDDPKNKSDCIRVKTLIKGKFPEVDLFLRWIDDGALDAIKRGYLKSLSFAIFLDESKPHELQEVYTFFFDYENHEIKVDINDNPSPVSLLNSRKMLQQLMRRFIIITQSFDPLPEQKFMSMRLLFNDNCPKDYQPLLFKDASNDTIATVKSKAKIYKITAGSLTTGCHDVHLNVIAGNSATTEDEYESDQTKEIIEVDPFVVPKIPSRLSVTQPEKPKLNIFKEQNQTAANHITPKVELQSQTTAMLKSFLQSSQGSMGSTQAISEVQCECGAANYNDTSLLKCSSCGFKKHSKCYGKTKVDHIMCFTCRSKSLKIPLHKNIQLLTNLRKLFRILAKKFPSSVTSIHASMGFTSDESVCITCDLLSYFIIHGLVIIGEKPLKKKQDPKQRPLNCSNLVVVDFDGIHRAGGENIPKGSEVAMTFVPALLGPDYIQYESTKTKYKTLFFKDTVNKCLCVDAELDQINLDSNQANDLYEEEEIVNSSLITSPVSKKSFKVTDHFSNLGFNGRRSESTQDSILMSPFRESIKRRISDDEYSDNENDENRDPLEGEISAPDNWYTSQPVLSYSRAQKKRNSVCNRFLDSGR